MRSNANRNWPAARAAAVMAALTCMVAAPAAAEAATTGGWNPTGSLATPRHSHTATLLRDGSVLVAGGWDNYIDGMKPSAERYDPESGTWGPAGSMSAGRAGHTATLLDDGTVLVVGGREATAERYDPETDSWSPAGTLGLDLMDHTATRLADGRVLVTGGGTAYDSNARANAEIFDPETGEWTPAASLSTARRRAVASLLADGTVLVAGGYSVGSQFASAERYDPAADAWLPAGSMSTPRNASAAAPLPDGSVLVIGGEGNTDVTRVVDRFDPRSGSWSRVANTNEGRIFAHAVPLPNGTVLLTGGSYNLGPSETYDPRHDVWIPTGPPAAALPLTTATRLENGSILSAGGFLDSAGTRASALLSLATEAAGPPLYFGDATVGHAEVTILPIRNRGQMPLFPTGLTLHGAASADFEVLFDECSVAGVVPGDTCFVAVRFTPSADGTRTATLTIAGNVPGGATAIPLSGRGTAVPEGHQPAKTNQIPQLRCKRGPRLVVCRGVPARATRGRVPVRLTRGGKVFAKGHLRRGTLRLKAQRQIAPQRYTLRIGNRRQAWSMAVQVQN